MKLLPEEFHGGETYLGRLIQPVVHRAALLRVLAAWEHLETTLDTETGDHHASIGDTTPGRHHRPDRPGDA